MKVREKRRKKIGIPAHAQPELFVADTALRKKGKGIGLLLVNQVIREHQGTLSIESNEGEGTTVTIRFPLHWEERGISGWERNDMH